MKLGAGTAAATARLNKIRVVLKNLLINTLKALTSVNKEPRPFFLGDNSIWSSPSVSSLGDYRIWRS